MKKLSLLFVILAAGCTDPESATKVLSDNGYTNIKTGGYGWVACGRDDVYSTEFSATSPSGKTVKGTVCHGFWKGSTIRFD